MRSSLQRNPNGSRARRAPKGRHVCAVSLPSTVQAIEPTLRGVIQALAQLGCPDHVCSDVEVALREAMQNAVLHGNGANPRKRVRIECYEQSDGSLWLVVRDSGRGFNPARVADPTASENLFRETGRGILLIRHFMDEVQFRRGGREIHMRKKR